MIIKSILDLDLYKYSMQNAVIKLFPRLKVKYRFTDRNQISFPDGFDVKLREEIKKMETLALTSPEKAYLNDKLGHFLPPTYIDFLYGYRYDSNEIKVWLDENNKLHIEIEGYWYRTILWETSLMSIISELYFIETGQDIDVWGTDFINNDLHKLSIMKKHNAYFSDFGTRRRYSYASQDKIVSLYSSNNTHIFVGTSNVHLAMKYNVKCLGTQAHEWIMVHASLYGYKMANEKALNNWISVYNGDLGIALSDTFTTDIFLKSFDMKMAKLFDGVRHDSGDPFEFTDKIIAHYKSLGIDPMSKTIIFSDGLNVNLAVEIKQYCVEKIKSSFGIGTHLTNDYGIKPLNMVIKVAYVWIGDRWVPAIKLSDNPIKRTGDIKEIEVCEYMLNI